MVNVDLVKRIHRLNKTAHEFSSKYLNSRPLTVSKHGLVLPSKSRHTFTIEQDIKDVYVLAAVTESSLLMTGGTDLAKTTLAKLMMNAFFGRENEGWHRLDVDIDFGKDTYSDVDFSVITEGKKMSEGFYNPSKFLSFPGFFLDEINRAHSKIGNKLLHFLDKDVTLPDGKRYKVGHLLPNGLTYQFQAIAINEGEGYSGTFEIDRALRRRTVIEVPMDIFRPTSLDRKIAKEREIELRSITLDNTESHLEDILTIKEVIDKEVSLHPTAEMFIAYLESFDYCKNSLTKEKGGISSKGGSIIHVCTQPTKLAGSVVAGAPMVCEFLKSFENELCPYVRGISMGISKNLIKVARGFALMRAVKFVEMLGGYLQGVYKTSLKYEISSPELFERSMQEYIGRNLSGESLAKVVMEKYLEELKVEKEDVDAAFGFVGYSKIGLADIWVQKHYQGNRFAAVKNFSTEASKKLEEGLTKPELADLDSLFKNKDPSIIGRIKGYCESQNPWLWEVLTPHLSDEKSAPIQEQVERLYD